MNLVFSIGSLFIFLLVVAISVYRNKMQHREALSYYKETMVKGDALNQKSLENQDRMIQLLECIVEKLSKEK